MIEKLLEELRILQKSADLLEKVYAEIGPYQDGKLSPKTWSEVKNHFKFDDSE